MFYPQVPSTVSPSSQDFPEFVWESNLCLMSKKRTRDSQQGVQGFSGKFLAHRRPSRAHRPPWLWWLEIIVLAGCTILATRVSRRSSKSSRSFNIVGSTEGAPSMTSSISSMVSMVSLLNFVFKSPLQCTAKTLPTPSNACLEDQSDKFHTVCW